MVNRWRELQLVSAISKEKIRFATHAMTGRTEQMIYFYSLGGIR